MITIIVRGPRACGKSYFIRNFLQPCVKMAQVSFPFAMGGFKIVEEFSPHQPSEIVNEFLPSEIVFPSKD